MSSIMGAAVAAQEREALEAGPSRDLSPNLFAGRC